jgi:hypothetical protein
MGNDESKLLLQKHVRGYDLAAAEEAVGRGCHDRAYLVPFQLVAANAVPTRFG